MQWGVHSPVDASFDGIIIGAGHNGLILQAYLGRLGLRVLSLDRNLQAGGGLSTIEDPAFPGVFHNIHSVFHRAVTLSPWYRDLDLERRGVRYIEPELNVAAVREDGASLRWYTDLDRTCSSLAEFSPRDAATFRALGETFAEVSARVILPLNAHPPLTREALRARLARSAVGRKFLEVEPLSACEFAMTRFEHPQVQALMLFLAGAREVDMNARGYGWLIPALIASPVKALLCVGGSAALARGLERAVQESGGVIWTGQTVTRILVENGRAGGVEMADGTQVRAEQFVASTLNPQQTVLELTGAEHWPGEVVEQVRRFRYNQVGPLFGLNVALREPPAYRAAARTPDLDRAFMTILGLETPDVILEMYRAHPRGEITRPLTLWGAAPTVHDPSQAREGFHTAFMWEKVPFACSADLLVGESAERKLGAAADPAHWDTWKEQHGEELLARWAEYAPNLRGDTIASRYALTPLDTVRHLPNMAGGDLTVGWLGEEQMGANRPTPALSGYATPLIGLYMAGSCMHPGGNITGYPGYNAAGVIARALGLESWWTPPAL
jgi:phytoene dehydrogenase-like protein